MSGEKLVELCERLRLAARDADEMARVVVLAAERVGAAGKYAGRRVRAEHSDAIREAAALIEQLQASRDTLFEAIKHGDDDHRAWLKEAIDAHFAGATVPAPRGAGRKEATIEQLQARLAEAEGVVDRLFADVPPAWDMMIAELEKANVPLMGIFSDRQEKMEKAGFALHTAASWLAGR